MEKRDICCLVAEDDAELRDLLNRILTKEGFTVVLAENGLKGCELLKTRKDVQLVITDIRMPEKNCVALLREGLDMNPNLKIILITAFGEVEEYLETMNIGAFEYLNKPFKMNDFLQVVSRAVESLEKDESIPPSL